MRICWLSLLSLPVGLAAIGGGPCAGPRSAKGSIILICAALGGMAAAAYGTFHICQSFRGLRTSSRFFGGVSLLAACFVVAVTAFYLLVGIVSLHSYARIYALSR